MNQLPAMRADFVGSFLRPQALKDAKVRCLFTRCLINNDQLGEDRIQEFLKLYEENKNEKRIIFII